MGFIAQDVERIFPEWVREGANGHKQLSLAGFEALAVKAIRKLAAQRKELVSAIAERDTSIELLEARLKAVEEQNAQLRAHNTRQSGLEDRLAAMEAVIIGRQQVSSQ